jgi:hypothetical protein
LVEELSGGSEKDEEAKGAASFLLLDLKHLMAFIGQ